MNGLASFSPHETESNMCLHANTLFEQYFILSCTWRVLCIWLPTNTPPKYCCLWMLKDWRGSSNPLIKGPANSLSVTLVLLIISSFCLRAFSKCLFNPCHLLYRLSHVFHLLDNNLSLTYSMNHWMVQSVHTKALHGSQAPSGWLTLIRHMEHHSFSRITG